MGFEIPMEMGRFWRLPGPLKALAVSVAVFAAKGIIQSSITARHQWQFYEGREGGKRA